MILEKQEANVRKAIVRFSRVVTLFFIFSNMPKVYKEKNLLEYMNYKIRNKKIDLLKFVPVYSVNVRNKKEYIVEIIKDDYYLTLSYDTFLNNKILHKRYVILIPRFIKANQETFEVLGLLKAEMGKKHDGKIVFCNHEYRLVNKVIQWFDNQVNLLKNRWKWYIKLNINEPIDKEYKKEIENKVMNYWIKKSNLSLERAYPKKISYIKNTKNKNLKFYDYGSLIIECKCNLLSQIIKRYVEDMSNLMPLLEKEKIKWFMKGIFAGEGCIESNKRYGHFRVHLTANNKKERDLYQKCLFELGIKIVQYEDYEEMIISRRENHIKLLKERLITLSYKKYSKFLNMLKKYDSFPEFEEWRNNLQKPWNKIPEEKIDKIVDLHKNNPNWPSWKIAEKVGGVSDIKVCRVRNEITKGF